MTKKAVTLIEQAEGIKDRIIERRQIAEANILASIIELEDTTGLAVYEITYTQDDGKVYVIFCGDDTDGYDSPADEEDDA